MLFRETQWVDELPSTNVALRERLLSGDRVPAGYVLATRHQTAGRGRYDRTWASAPDENLTFSFLLHTNADPARIPSLPMAVALAVADLLIAHRIVPETKWPNDVLVGPRKVCGILAENVAATAQDAEVIVGVGLNVNMPAEKAAAIDQPATSMHIETGRTFDIEALLDELLGGLVRRIADWERGGFMVLREDWGRYCAFQGETVTVRDGERTRRGRLKAFGESGQMVLEEPDGTLREVWAGDITR